MSTSTGPVLATGAITVINQSVLNGHPLNLRIPVATGVVAMIFAMAEKALGRGVSALAWIGLATVVLTRVDPSSPSPAESALAWWEGRQQP